MQTAIVTLFPELFAVFLDTSFVKRARETNRLGVHLEQLREHGLGRHRSVDDTPYGGGSGMVMRPDCVVAAMEAAECAIGGRAVRVLLTPQGEPFRQSVAEELSAQERLLLVCGRYEGFDERVRLFVDREVSLGDFVLTGGEVAAMAIIEACVRLLPDVLGNAVSSVEESFSAAWGGGLEYPQFTRPPEFRGHGVPEVLVSGNHARIAAWRREQATERTAARRPDLERRNPGVGRS
ncbi:MAG: tRNA (guanosine(37)-N1)-methyltransferase TrmD [Polyangiaceae bacterium]|nr:tRNA (guanosine(37)-N1)-methyltransferase TrmD [Polyangiaceae bacterium]